MKNKERNGYMSCPCRLASGNREKDRDIMCPCVYRAQDVEKYGACFCGLYVSSDWNEDKIPHLFVPERRPSDKLELSESSGYKPGSFAFTHCYPRRG